MDCGIEQAQRAGYQRAVKSDQIPQALPAFHCDVVENRVVCRPKNEARRLSMPGDVLNAVKFCGMIMQPLGEFPREVHVRRVQRDRKSTRLNSSHLGISYAVFCLKK